MTPYLAALALSLPTPAPAESPIEPIDPVLASLSTSATAPALLGSEGALSWTFVEANYVWNDIDAVDESIDGWELRGSLEIFMNFFLQASYSMLSGDVDLDQGRLGAGWHLPVGERLDAYGILSFATAELDGSGFDEDEDGLYGQVGARFLLLDKLEVNGEVIWQDIDESDTGIGLGARWYFMENLSAGAGVTLIDEDETFSVGARFQF